MNARFVCGCLVVVLTGPWEVLQPGFAPTESGVGAAIDADLDLESSLAGGRAEATLPEEQTTVAEGE